MIQTGAVSSRAISCAYLNYCTTPNKYVQYGKQKIYILSAFFKAIMKTANRTILRELPCFCFEVCAASEKQLCRLNRELIAC